MANCMAQIWMDMYVLTKVMLPQLPLSLFLLQYFIRNDWENE